MPFESPEKDAWEELPLTNPTAVKDPSALARILNRIIKYLNKAEVAPDPAIQGDLIQTNTDDIATNVTAIGVNTTAIGVNTTAIGLNTTHRTSNGSDHSFIDQDVTDGSTPTFSTVTMDGIIGNIKAKDANYTVLGTDFCIVCNLTANRTVTLPTASGRAGQMYVFKKISVSFTLSIEQNGSETIDGSTLARSLSAQYSRMTVISDGSNWHIIGEN